MKEYIVITGASSGIGQALAISFANSGSNLLITGRNELALQCIKSLSGNKEVSIIIADLAEDAELDKIASALDKQDKIRYLIHCAASSEPHSSLTTITRSELQRSIDINVMAPIFLTQKLAPYFDETTRVLFIGSDYVGANKIRPNVTGAYGISKSALRAAVEYFRHEYEHTALIGYLNPGSTNTPMFEAIKTALVNQGIFSNSVQPTSPDTVAEFIRSILEKTSNEDYVSIDWDFRNHQYIEEKSLSKSI